MPATRTSTVTSELGRDGPIADEVFPGQLIAERLIDRSQLRGRTSPAYDAPVRSAILRSGAASNAPDRRPTVNTHALLLGSGGGLVERVLAADICAVGEQDDRAGRELRFAQKRQRPDERVVDARSVGQARRRGERASQGAAVPGRMAQHRDAAVERDDANLAGRARCATKRARPEQRPLPAGRPACCRSHQVRAPRRTAARCPRAGRRARR